MSPHPESRLRCDVHAEWRGIGRRQILSAPSLSFRPRGGFRPSPRWTVRPRFTVRRLIVALASAGMFFGAIMGLKRRGEGFQRVANYHRSRMASCISVGPPGTPPSCSITAAARPSPSTPIGGIPIWRTSIITPHAAHGSHCCPTGPGRNEFFRALLANHKRRFTCNPLLGVSSVSMIAAFSNHC
jgi:hypothetical protein